MSCYPLAIEPGDERTAYGAVVPDIPGAVSAGDTRDEARRNAVEAARIVLEDWLARGEPVPAPGRIEDYRDNPVLTGWEWEVIKIEVTP